MMFTMSAISGIFHFTGKPIAKTDLMRMNTAMQHHGQDGSGIWMDNYCGLAQQVSYLTDESRHETLPLIMPEYPLVLVTNSRLSNKANHSVGDGEFILSAYVKWQLEFVHHLLGEYSFALWDGKLQRLICVTDHFNARPLYYYLDQHQLAVASEIRALHSLESIARRPNLNKIARNDFVRLQYEVGETNFADIQFLPPASLMVADKSGCKIQTYWKPSLGKQLVFKNDEEFAEAFQNVFSAAVSSATRTHLPVALQLSGGLDSSAIAVMASRVLQPQNRKLICLSNTVPDALATTIEDERYFVEKLNDSNFVKQKVIDEWRGPFDHLDSMKSSLNSSPQHYQHRAINDHARRYGAKIVLHGTLGEITASHHGYGYLSQLFRRGKWLKLSKEVLAHHSIYHRSFMSMIWRDIIQPSFAPFSVSKSNPTKHSFIRRDFMHQHISPEQSQWTAQQLTHSRHENSLTMMNWFLRHASTMFSQLDEAPASAVYWSNPYFDKRLVEFCINVSDEYRFKNGYTRSILRIGMQRLLPNEIRWRTTKGPFLPDYHVRYNKQLFQAKQVVDELSQYSLVKEIIDVKKLQESLAHASSSNKIDNPTNYINFLVIPRTIYLAQFLSSF